MYSEPAAWRLIHSWNFSLVSSPLYAQTEYPCSIAARSYWPVSVLLPCPGFPVKTVIAPSAYPPIYSSSAGIIVLIRGTVVGS